jgi:hypothetical protein
MMQFCKFLGGGVTPGNGLDCGAQLLVRQRYRAAVVVMARPVVHGIKAVDENLAWQDLDATILHCRGVFSEEAERSATRPDGEHADLREDHPVMTRNQPIQTDQRNIRPKISASCRKYVYLSA